MDRWSNVHRLMGQWKATWASNETFYFNIIIYRGNLFYKMDHQKKECGKTARELAGKTMTVALHSMMRKTTFFKHNKHNKV